MNKATQYFGQRLRQARERAGISLDTIAESTKISRWLLADLERGDASKWPPGIYRRAFARDYALAIGLPADDVVTEFLELFPEPGAEAPVRQPQPGDLRMALAADPDDALVAAARRLLVSALELAVIVAVGWAGARLAGWDVLKAIGALAVIYYPIAAACTHRRLAFRWPRPAIASSSVPSLRDVARAVLHRAPVRPADERVA